MDPTVKLQEKLKDSNIKFKLKEVSEMDVMKIIRKLSKKKSCGHDGISAEVLKLGAEAIAGPLTLIINTSITTGKFPTKWKQAKVTPIYKKGDRKTKENYRPVALLSVSAMILEKVVKVLTSGAKYQSKIYVVNDVSVNRYL